MIRNAITGLALFAASLGAAEGATVSQVFDIGTEGVGGDAVDTVQIEGFDPILGTLESVTVSVDIEGVGNGLLFNRTDVVTRIPGGTRFAVGFEGETLFDNDQGLRVVEPIGPSALLDLATGVVSHSFEQSFAQGSAIFDAIAGGGTLDVLFGFPAALTQAPLSILTQISNFSGTVQVDFEFEPAPEIAPVPLPASALFLLAGLGALMLPRLGRGPRG